MKKKRVIIAALIAIAGVSGVLWYTNKRDNPSPVIAPIESGVNILSAGKISELDQDNDGLKDWEERLWGTDAVNPDTDADGTFDGEEIKQNRNPKKAGPDDFVQAGTGGLIEIAGTSTMSGASEFSKEFILTYASMKQGKEITEEEAIRLADLLVSDLQKSSANLEPTIYTAKNIVFAADNSTASYQTYTSILISSIKKNNPEKPENEGIILKRALDNNAPDELKKLDTIAKGYEGLLQDMLTIPVPPALQSRHVEFTNSISGLIAAIQGMRLAFTSPISAINGVNLYSTASNRIGVALLAINEQLKLQGFSL